LAASRNCSETAVDEFYDVLKSYVLVKSAEVIACCYCFPEFFGLLRDVSSLDKLRTWSMIFRQFICKTLFEYDKLDPSVNLFRRVNINCIFDMLTACELLGLQAFLQPELINKMGISNSKGFASFVQRAIESDRVIFDYFARFVKSNWDKFVAPVIARFFTIVFKTGDAQVVKSLFLQANMPLFWGIW
jgi:hypothetical protein